MINNYGAVKSFRIGGIINAVVVFILLIINFVVNSRDKKDVQEKVELKLKDLSGVIGSAKQITCQIDNMPIYAPADNPNSTVASIVADCSRPWKIVADRGRSWYTQPSMFSTFVFRQQRNKQIVVTRDRKWWHNRRMALSGSVPLCKDWGNENLYGHLPNGIRVKPAHKYLHWLAYRESSDSHPPNIQFVGQLMISDHQATVRMLYVSIAHTVSNFDDIMVFSFFVCNLRDLHPPTIFFSFALAQNAYKKQILCASFYCINCLVVSSEFILSF